MPLGGKLSQEDIAVLKSWIDSGAAWDASVTFADAAAIPASTTEKKFARDAAESTGSVELTGRIRPHRRDHGGKIAREQRRVGPIELHTG
jgi:hypothetical protein